MEVYFDISNLTPGPIAAKVELFTRNTGEAAATVYIHGWIEKRYGIWPDPVSLGLVRAGEHAKAQFHIVLDPKILAYDDPQIKKRVPRFSGSQNVSTSFVTAAQGTTDDWEHLTNHDKGGQIKHLQHGVPTVLTYEVPFTGRKKTGTILEWTNTIPVPGTIGDAPLRHVSVPITGIVSPTEALDPKEHGSCNCGNMDTK